MPKTNSDSSLGILCRTGDNETFVPNRFKNTVLRHLLLNFSRNINGQSPPLMLAIQGNKGEGKSFMIEKLCCEYRIRFFPISGATLCGAFEGDSVKKIQSLYENVCFETSISREFACIMIDDFHKSLAATEQSSVNYTSNADALVGYLMNLSDHPYVHGVRVPIILTGNNFTSIYPALTRFGRMDFFDWCPTIEEKTEIVFAIFKSYYPNVAKDNVCKLVEKYKAQYVGFFKSIAVEMFFGQFEGALNDFMGFIEKGGNLDSVSDYVGNHIIPHQNCSYQIMSQCAKGIASRMAKNYDLKESR